MTGPRLVVDTERCEGHGLCEQVAPDLVQLDDEAMARVLVDRVPAARADAARAAAASCPVAALHDEATA